MSLFDCEPPQAPTTTARTLYDAPIIVFWDPSCCVPLESFNRLSRKFTDMAILETRKTTAEELPAEIIVPDPDAAVFLACAPLSSMSVRICSKTLGQRKLIVLCTTDDETENPGPHWERTKKLLIEIPEDYNLEKLFLEGLEGTKEKRPRKK